jgi:hypothetical protein
MSAAPARMGTRTARSSRAKKAGLASCAVHAAEGLQVPAFIDDRDRDQCGYRGRAARPAGW